MRRATYVSIAAIAVLTLFFLLPVVPKTVSTCPVGMGCPPSFTTQIQVSLTYNFFSVGGIMGGGRYFFAYLPGSTCQTSYGTETLYSTNASLTTTATRISTGSTCSPNIITIA